MQAAKKHTQLLLVSAFATVALTIAGSVSAASSSPRDRTPPSAPKNIVVTEATQTSIIVSWTASLDSGGVRGYRVTTDDERAFTSSTTQRVTRLECGESIRVSVRAYDRAGNRSPAATTTASTAACVDTRPPSPPRNIRQVVSAEDAVVLAWARSSDNVGVVGYNLYWNGVRVQSVYEPTAALTGLRCGSTYQYVIDAVDAAGNRSIGRTAWVLTAPCAGDEVPPSPPSALAAGNVTPSSVTLGWTAATDDVGVTAYDVFREGVRVGTVTATSSVQAGLSCGKTYAFGVAALDAAGNSSARAQLSATTSPCSAPTPAPDVPTAPAADTTPPSQPARLTVSTATGTSVGLAWQAATDNAGVVGYGVYVNGRRVATVSQLQATVPALVCGTAYTLGVDAADAAGNRSPLAEVTASTTACVDASAPTAPTSVTASSRTASSIALTWLASTDNVGVVGYGLYLNGSLVGTSAATSGVVGGLRCNANYTLGIDAFDAAGNRSPSATVIVSTTACPDTSAPSAPPSVNVSSVTPSSVTLSWTASSDNVGVAGYDVFRNGTKTATVTSTSSSQTGLSCGTTYAFGVESFDGSGNRSTRTSVDGTTAACSTPAPPPGGGGSGVYYVSPSGNDAGNGSQASPWRTVKKACDTVAGGRILVAAGTYTETGACHLRSATSLVGAGVAVTSIRSAGPAVDAVIEVQNTSGPQTVSDLTLDGQSRTTSNFGMRVTNVVGLTITRVRVTGFKNAADFKGGGISVLGATDFELSHSELSNNATETSDYCTGDLGLGNLTRASIHDLRITSPQGYNVKMTSGFGRSRDVVIYNNVFNALTSRCARWSTIGVELWFEAENVVFRNNWTNRTLSLPHGGSSAAIADGFRWRIHNNHFQLPGGSTYAIESGLTDSIIDHNLFEGGLYPLGQFHNPKVANGNDVHHNVFDNTEGPAAVWLDVSRVSDTKFHRNTVVLRRSSWRDGVFSFGELTGYTGSTIEIRENIFKSTVPVGDKLGLGLAGATLVGNAFHNIAGRGSAQITADPQLPLAGGFPTAYVPSATSAAARVGAFADGLWSVGPT